MSAQQDSAEQEVIESGTTGVVDGIDKALTPLQYHYLSLLRRLIALKSSYQTDPNFEAWMMGAINKAIYSTLRGGCHLLIGQDAERASGCSESCSGVPCQTTLLTGPRWASRSQSGSGCVARFVRGPRNCFARR